VRAAAVLLVIGFVAVACGSAPKTYSAQDVETAFRQHRIALARDRGLERTFREAVAGGRGMIGSMLGRDVPVPEEIFVAREEGDFYVAVFRSPTSPRGVVGEAKELDAIGRQGLTIFNRANVVVVADKSLEPRARAALRRLG